MIKVPVKLSAKEAVFTPAMVARAKALGINLNEFAPNSDQFVDNGKQGYNGDEPKAYKGASRWEFSPGQLAENKAKMKEFGKGIYNKTAGALNDGTIADAFNLGTAAHNWWKATQIKTPRVAEQFIAPPRLLNPRIDTSAHEQAIALSTANAWDKAKLSGTNNMAVMSALHANELEARGKVASGAINQGIQIENQNTQIENEFAQKRADSIYNRSMKQLEVNSAIQEKRDAAIGNSQTAISDTLRERANYNHDLEMMKQSRLALSAPEQVASLVKLYPGKFENVSYQQLMKDIVDYGSDKHPVFRKKYNLDV